MLCLSAYLDGWRVLVRQKKTLEQLLAGLDQEILNEQQSSNAPYEIHMSRQLQEVLQRAIRNYEIPLPLMDFNC
jgi:hypothetical protein